MAWEGFKNPEKILQGVQSDPMTSKIVRILMALATVLPMATLAQAGPGASSSTPAASAAAPSVSATKFGVISVQDAILATNEGQKDFEALGKKFEPRRNELKSLNDEIDGLKKQLDSQSTKINEESRSTLLKQIQDKQKTLTRNQEDAQNDFVSQQNEIAQKILQKLGPVIDKYAKDNGLALIIDISKPWPDGPVLWAGPSVDITKAVVDIYNSQSGVPAAPSASRPGGATRPAGTTKPSTTPPPKPEGSAPPK